MITDISKPELWIIAGPNGSGKSTVYGLLAVESPKNSVWIINPDLLSKKISEVEGDVEANLKAVQRIETWLYASVAAYQTIGVETVLSSPKYRALVLDAKSKGFSVNFIYVYLDRVELNIARVKQRVEKGGHDVEEAKIRARHKRSIEQMSWFFEASDKAFIYNNSGAQPKQIATKNDTNFTYSGDLKGEIYEAIFANYPDLKTALESKV